MPTISNNFNSSYSRSYDTDTTPPKLTTPIIVEHLHVSLAESSSFSSAQQPTSVPDISSHTDQLPLITTGILQAQHAAADTVESLPVSLNETFRPHLFQQHASLLTSVVIFSLISLFLILIPAVATYLNLLVFQLHMAQSTLIL